MTIRDSRIAAQNSKRFKREKIEIFIDFFGYE